MDPNQSVVYLMGGFLLKEIFDILKQRFIKDNDKRDLGIEQNTTALNDLRITLTKLEVQIGHILEKMAVIPKMEKDLNAAHAKLRDMGQGNGQQ